MQKGEDMGHFGSEASPESYAIQRGVLPEYYPGSAVAGSFSPGHFPCLRSGERPCQPKHLSTSGRQVGVLTIGVESRGLIKAAISAWRRMRGMVVCRKWHTCGTVAGSLNTAGAPPLPHRIPSTSPP